MNDQMVEFDFQVKGESWHFAKKWNTARYVRKSYRIVYLLAVIINYKIDDTLQNISTKQQKYTKCT